MSRIFGVVYWATALTTFKHTAWAAATVFEGSFPVDAPVEEQAFWWLTGALMAVAIDIGLWAISRSIHPGSSKRYYFVLLTAFVVLALSSGYAQMLYSYSHTSTVEYGDGVTLYWRGWLEPIIDARVVLFPLMLPIFITIYTLARIAQDAEMQKAAGGKVVIRDATPEHPALTVASSYMIPWSKDGMLYLTCRECRKTWGAYKDEASRLIALKTHVTKYHSTASPRMKQGS